VGQDIKLTASDGFQTGRLIAPTPRGAPKAAIVVIQEIFGVNHHIRSVCDRLAGEGYVAIRARRSSTVSNLTFTSGYSPDEVANARKFVANPRLGGDACAIPRPAIDAVKDVGPIGIIGFCLGGSIAYAACDQIVGPVGRPSAITAAPLFAFADDKPQVPTTAAFSGEKGRGALR